MRNNERVLFIVPRSIQICFREFTAFLSGVEGRFVFPYVKCFRSFSSTMVNAFVVFVLACGDGVTRKH